MAYIQTFPDCPFEVIQPVSNVLGAAKASVPQKVGRHCPSPKKGSEVRVALVPGRAQGLASAVVSMYQGVQARKRWAVGDRISGSRCVASTAFIAAFDPHKVGRVLTVSDHTMEVISAMSRLRRQEAECELSLEVQHGTSQKSKRRTRERTWRPVRSQSPSRPERPYRMTLSFLHTAADTASTPRRCH